MSHPIGQYQEKIRLILRVHPEALFHFKERPLAENQVISDPLTAEGWYQVEVNIPETILLIPWLLSMGGWIKVVEPLHIQQEIYKRIKSMILHYQ